MLGAPRVSKNHQPPMPTCGDRIILLPRPQEKDWEAQGSILRPESETPSILTLLGSIADFLAPLFKSSSFVHLSKQTVSSWGQMEGAQHWQAEDLGLSPDCWSMGLLWTLY